MCIRDRARESGDFEFYEEEFEEEGYEEEGYEEEGFAGESYEEPADIQLPGEEE